MAIAHAQLRQDAAALLERASEHLTALTQQAGQSGQDRAAQLLARLCDLLRAEAEAIRSISFASRNTSAH